MTWAVILAYLMWLNRRNMKKSLSNNRLAQSLKRRDPDGDRLIVCQIEAAARAKTLELLGVDFLMLDEKRLLTIYTPNQAFLMLMDFHAKQLKAAGLWQNYPRFMIKTTPSALAWGPVGELQTALM